jgi:hypothetical protein
MEKPSYQKRQTLETHQRQFTWQILIPILLTTVAVLTAGGFLLADVVTGGGGPRVWADVSLIWLIIPAIFFGLAFLVILVTLVYGLGKVLQGLPPLTDKAQGLFFRVNGLAQAGSNSVIKPFFWLHQVRAAFKSIFKH